MYANMITTCTMTVCYNFIYSFKFSHYHLKKYRRTATMHMHHINMLSFQILVEMPGIA